MCRQNVVSSGFHDLSQSLPDVTPQHPQYQFICAQRRKIRKLKLHNQRTNSFQNPEVVASDTSTLSKKEARRLKNRESAALSRKRKMNEIAEVQNLVLKLNQENIALRQRISMLEASVQSSIFPQQQNMFPPPPQQHQNMFPPPPPQQQQSAYQQSQPQLQQQNMFQPQQQSGYQQQPMPVNLGPIETLPNRNPSPYPPSSQFISSKPTRTNISRPIENGFPFTYDGQSLNENPFQNQIQKFGNAFITYPPVPYQNAYPTQFPQSGR